MSKYSIERAELGEEWDTFVQKSSNGTVFSYSDYLHAVNRLTDVWYVMKGEEKKAAVSLMLTSDLKNTMLNDFVVYNGLMFTGSESNKNTAQANAERFSITEFVAEWLPREYRTIEMQLHPSVIDIRPFLWVNYHDKWEDGYYADIRYTSILTNPTLEGMGNSRRQEIMYGLRDAIEVVEAEESDPYYFVDMYCRMMGYNARSETADYMVNVLLCLLGCDLGRMFKAYLLTGEIASMSMFVKDNKRSYYLFGANESEFKDRHAGSLCVWEGIQRMGMEECDMEGINSPNRGHFKTSFGGIVVPYYHLVYN